MRIHLQGSPTAPEANVIYTSSLILGPLHGEYWRESPTNGPARPELKGFCVFLHRCLKAKAYLLLAPFQKASRDVFSSLSGHIQPWKVMLQWAVLGTLILNAHLLTLIGMLAGDNSGLLGLSFFLSGFAIKASWIHSQKRHWIMVELVIIEFIRMCCGKEL